MSNTHSSQSGIRKLTPEEQDWYMRIRGRASAQIPWLSHILFLLEPVMDDELGTFAVDAKARVYLSRQGFTGNMTEEEQAFALAHEGMHVFRHHAERTLEGCNFKAWALACDAEINDDLKKLRALKTPEGLVYPSTLGQKVGLSAEEYYGAIEKKAERISDALLGAGKDESSRQGENNSNGAGENRAVSPVCSGVNNEKSHEADGVSAGRENAEIDSAVLDASRAILDSESNQPGKIPAHLVRAAQANMGDDKIDWVDVFSNVVANSVGEISSGRAQYSYRKANRRAGNYDVMPGLIDYKVKLVVIIDTSGSMNTALLNRCVSELGSINRQSNVQMKYAPADAKAYELQDFNDDTAFELEGGGGTNMGAAIDGALEAGDNIGFYPDFVVVLTDGWTPWSRESDIPVIAGIVGNSLGDVQNLVDEANGNENITAIPVAE